MARKRSKGLVEKLQRYNHEAKIRYGYIPADTPPPNSTPASLSKKKKK